MARSIRKKRSAARNEKTSKKAFAVLKKLSADKEPGVRVAVTGAGASVFRQRDMERALGDDFSAAAVADIAQAEDGLNSDIHASAEYRAHLVTVMAKRAVAAAH